MKPPDVFDLSKCTGIIQGGPLWTMRCTTFCVQTTLPYQVTLPKSLQEQALAFKRVLFKEQGCDCQSY